MSLHPEICLGILTKCEPNSSFLSSTPQSVHIDAVLYYPDTVLDSPCLILLMQRTVLRSDTSQFDKLLV